jgi:hypothetical protein
MECVYARNVERGAWSVELACDGGGSAPFRPIFAQSLIHRFQD